MMCDNNNKATVSGTIVSEPIYSHESYGKEFYQMYISVLRDSGTPDIVPVIIPESFLLESGEKYTSRQCKIKGRFQSYNKKDESGRSHLELYFFARQVDFYKKTLPMYEQINNLFVDGFICKEPIYRKTPLGREIAEIMVAVNRPYGKSDYIPCIAWGSNARLASNFKIGTQIRVGGRIQSRRYQKIYDDDFIQIKTAYEISIKDMEVMR